MLLLLLWGVVVFPLCRMKQTQRESLPINAPCRLADFPVVESLDFAQEVSVHGASVNEHGELARFDRLGVNMISPTAAGFPSSRRHERRASVGCGVRPRPTGLPRPRAHPQAVGVKGVRPHHRFRN